MPVADWTIQRQAFSGPLRGGGGRSLVPARDTPAQCCRAPLWRCRLIPVLAAWVIPAGVGGVACSPCKPWPDDAPNVAFADPASVAKVGKEPDTTSLLAGGKSSCASGGCAGGTAGADAASALRAVASLFGDGTRSARWGSTTTPPLRALGPAISSTCRDGREERS
jgi:hypothetical protein